MKLWLCVNAMFASGGYWESLPVGSSGCRDRTDDPNQTLWASYAFTSSGVSKYIELLNFKEVVKNVPEFCSGYASTERII